MPSHIPATAGTRSADLEPRRDGGGGAVGADAVLDLHDCRAPGVGAGRQRTRVHRRDAAGQAKASDYAGGPLAAIPPTAQPAGPCRSTRPRRGRGVAGRTRSRLEVVDHSAGADREAVWRAGRRFLGRYSTTAGSRPAYGQARALSPRRLGSASRRGRPRCSGSSPLRRLSAVAQRSDLRRRRQWRGCGMHEGGRARTARQRDAGQRCGAGEPVAPGSVGPAVGSRFHDGPRDSAAHGFPSALHLLAANVSPLTPGSRSRERRRGFRTLGRPGGAQLANCSAASLA